MVSESRWELRTRLARERAQEIGLRLRERRKHEREIARMLREDDRRQLRLPFEAPSRGA